MLLSLPRRRPGQGIGTGEWAGEPCGVAGPPAGAPAAGACCCCDDDDEADCCTLLAAAAAAAVVAAVAAVEYEEDVVCLLGCDVVVARLGVAVCWRKAAKTVERKKGRCDGMFAGLVGLFLSVRMRRLFSVVDDGPPGLLLLVLIHKSLCPPLALVSFLAGQAAPL